MNASGSAKQPLAVVTYSSTSAAERSSRSGGSFGASGRAGGFGWVVGVDRLGHADKLREAGADVVVQDLADLLADSPAGGPA